MRGSLGGPMKDEWRVILADKGLGEYVHMVPMNAIDNEGVRSLKPL